MLFIKNIWTKQASMPLISAASPVAMLSLYIVYTFPFYNLCNSLFNPTITHEYTHIAVPSPRFIFHDIKCQDHKRSMLARFPLHHGIKSVHAYLYQCTIPISGSFPWNRMMKCNMVRRMSVGWRRVDHKIHRLICTRDRIRHNYEGTN